MSPGPPRARLRAPTLKGQPAGRDLVRDRNESEIFATILTQGPLPRSEVALRTGLSQATLTKVVQRFLDQKPPLVKEEIRSAEPDRLGRPARLLTVNEEDYLAVGIRVMPDELASAGGKLLGVIINLGGNVVASDEAKFLSSEPAAVVKDIVGLTRLLLDQKSSFRKSSKRIIGLGVEVGGHVDLGHGEVRFSPNLKWRKPVPLAKLVKDEVANILDDNVGLEVLVENDINALAIYEQWFGKAYEDQTFAVVWVGEGIGSGIVLDNQLVHGASGGAGEFGHVVIDPNGDDCRCGAVGCLETVASIPVILEAVRSHDGYADVSDIRAVVQLASRDDPVVQPVLEKAGAALGKGISTLVNLLNPRKILLAGPPAAYGGDDAAQQDEQEGILFSRRFMEEMRKAVKKHSYPSLYNDCSIEVRRYTDDKGAQGAASIVVGAFIADPLPGA